MDAISEAHLFSSSPARPSHHRTQLPIKSQKDADRFSTAAAISNPNPRKRTASAANLITPPTSPEKPKTRSKKAFDDSEDEKESGDEVMETPRRSSGRTTRALKQEKGMARPVRRGQAGAIRWPSARKGDQASPKSTAIKSPSSVSPRTRADRMNLDSDQGGKSPVTPIRNAVAPDRMDISPLRAIPRPTTPTPTSRKTKGGKEKQVGPIRDSPNNPFLRSSPRTPAPRASLAEKPTVTYVFRGVKAVFKNPAYGIPEPVPGDPSTLSPQHLDFSPDLITAPKLLWPSASVESDEEEDSPRAKRYKIRSLQLSPEAGTSGGQSAPKKKRRLNKDGDVFKVQRSPEAMAL